MIAKIFKGIWTGINFSRRLVLNILFLLLVIVFIAGITSDEDKITVEDGSVLRLNLNGPIVEEKTYVDPIEAAISDATSGSEVPSEILLDDIVKVINEAAKDERITVLLLDLQEMPKAHLNKLKQITNAIDRFKETGKKVIASGYYYTQAQYYIASHANEVTMHPYGSVAIEGFAMYPLYFKDALEKLEVTQHIFRVGTFKSAVEPFIRNDMSDAAKQANRVWLGALWNEYKQDVAAARPFDESNFDETMDVYLAKMQAANG
ncbi:S49 family peptidase, partial [Pseudoalteromonas sp.]|uniref:S49 family peptidase n=1 Tax=Pseudoalteromonas sp. TaxID=53249 RepID=UPI002356ECFC